MSKLPATSKPEIRDSTFLSHLDFVIRHSRSRSLVGLPACGRMSGLRTHGKFHGSESGDALPIGNRRYSRLEICATARLPATNYKQLRDVRLAKFLWPEKSRHFGGEFIPLRIMRRRDAGKNSVAMGQWRRDFRNPLIGARHLCRFNCRRSGGLGIFCGAAKIER